MVVKVNNGNKTIDEQIIMGALRQTMIVGAEKLRIILDLTK